LYDRVATAFIAALTHPNLEVRAYAASGIVFGRDRAIAIRSVSALALEAKLVDEAIQSRSAKNTRGARAGVASAARDAAAFVRSHFWDGGIPSDAYQKLDVSRGLGSRVCALALSIFIHAPDEPESVEAFASASEWLVQAWRRDDDDHAKQSRRNFEFESELRDLLVRFLMASTDEAMQRVLAPVVQATEHHYREIGSFIGALILHEDRAFRPERFWQIWQLFALTISQASWVSDLDKPYARGHEVISAIFLGDGWREGVRHWKSLDGYGHFIDRLLASLPVSSTVFGFYVRFLYNVGAKSLPTAFVQVAEMERKSPGILEESNSIFTMEVLLLRYVYGAPRELKDRKELRVAVLFLLDALIEGASSSAFRMRDDFVTP
jgi:hypothetical protein